MNVNAGGAWAAVCLGVTGLISLLFAIGTVVSSGWLASIPVWLVALGATVGFAAVVQAVTLREFRAKRRWEAIGYGQRADYEHQELTRGNLGVGIYGRYPPFKEEQT